jgi:hypothetical protein
MAAKSALVAHNCCFFLALSPAMELTRWGDTKPVTIVVKIGAMVSNLMAEHVLCQSSVG